MTVKTVVVFHDGREETIRDDYLDLRDAVTHAVSLADNHGSDKGDGHGPPDWICVKRGSHVEISIKVLVGGLIPKMEC